MLMKFNVKIILPVERTLPRSLSYVYHSTHHVENNVPSSGSNELSYSRSRFEVFGWSRTIEETKKHCPPRGPYLIKSVQDPSASQQRINSSSLHVCFFSILSFFSLLISRCLLTFGSKNVHVYSSEPHDGPARLGTTIPGSILSVSWVVVSEKNRCLPANGQVYTAS